MLNITSYSRNANQNYWYNEISDRTLVRITIIKNSTNNKFWRAYGKKGTLIHCWWECELVQQLWKTLWRVLKKLKIELHIWSRNPTPGHISRQNFNSNRSTRPVFMCFTLCLVAQSCPTLRPRGLQPARLLRPWGFSRQEYWSRLPCPPPGDLPNLGIEPRSPTLQADSLPSEPPGKTMNAGVGSLSLL